MSLFWNLDPGNGEKEKTINTGNDQRMTWAPFLILLFALLVRLAIAPFVPGYATDIGCFKGWAEHVARNGCAQFYSGAIFADYPPGYILVLYLLGKIRIAFNLDFNSGIYLALIKLPSILADMVTGYLLLLAARKSFSNRYAFILLLFYVFNPAIMLNSTAWGQIDSFFTLLILLSLWSLTEKRFEIASAILVYALLVKPQAFFFFPILLFALVEKKNLKTFFLSVISGLLVFFVVVFPFSSGRGIFWIVDKYTETLSSYPYAALNAFNLFALSGGNWVNENNPFLFLSYRVWGYIFLLTIFLVTAVLFFRWKDRFKVYPLSFFLVASVFILSSKMHERYLYPALALALFCYVYYRDRRIFTTYLGFSVTHFLNVGLVLLYSWYNIFHLYRYDLSVLFISLTNVILYVYALFIGGDLFREGQGKKRMKREL